MPSCCLGDRRAQQLPCRVSARGMTHRPSPPPARPGGAKASHTISDNAHMTRPSPFLPAGVRPAPGPGPAWRRCPEVEAGLHAGHQPRRSSRSHAARLRPPSLPFAPPRLPGEPRRSLRLFASPLLVLVLVLVPSLRLASPLLVRTLTPPSLSAWARARARAWGFPPREVALGGGRGWAGARARLSGLGSSKQPSRSSQAVGPPPTMQPARTRMGPAAAGAGAVDRASAVVDRTSEAGAEGGGGQGRSEAAGAPVSPTRGAHPIPRGAAGPRRSGEGWTPARPVPGECLVARGVGGRGAPGERPPAQGQNARDAHSALGRVNAGLHRIQWSCRPTWRAPEGAWASRGTHPTPAKVNKPGRRCQQSHPWDAISTSSLSDPGQRPSALPRPQPLAAFLASPPAPLSASNAASVLPADFLISKDRASPCQQQCLPLPAVDPRGWPRAAWPRYVRTRSSPLASGLGPGADLLCSAQGRA